MGRRPLLVGAAVLVVSVVACSADPSTDPSAGGDPPAPDSSTSAPPSSVTPTTPAPTTAPTTTPAPAPGTVPPSWLGTRVLPLDPVTGAGRVRPTPPALRERRFTLPDTTPALPGRGFAWDVRSPAPDAVVARSTWQPRCPVARDDLAWVRVSFRGFDGARHSGELLVERTAARPMVRVFRRLWQADFPLEQMRITTRAERDAAPTGDGNTTGAFVCRAVTGGGGYSQHAYGLAVDVNPFQNPYVKGRAVVPELASSYLDRSDVRPGMIRPDDVVVRAFAAEGWEWGGGWRTLKDYQHFSRNGR